MRYKLTNPPATDKDGLINSLKLAANYVDLGDADSMKSAAYMLSDLIDSVTPERVVFQWKASRKQLPGNDVAAYAMDNPAMVD